MVGESAGILREYGLKHTSGREALLKVLLHAGKPLSHKEICAGMAPLHYNPVSVYRSLEIFLTLGIVHRIEDESRTRLFALCTCKGNRRCHPHFFCRVCGKCECLKGYPMPEIPGLNDTCIVEEKRFYIKGICAECAAAGS